MIPVAADLAAIVAIGDFFECVTFTLSNGSTLCINGKFTDASDAVVMYGSVEIEAQKPTLQCQTSDVEGVVRNKDTVTVRGTRFQVERNEKVGTGMSVIYLKT